MPEPLATAGTRVPLPTVAGVFLRLGATSFGGPAAHIALMEEECVRRRGWITHDEFLDLISAANLIPGPNSTEVAIHVGHRVAGWPGLIVAGAAFILPAFLIVLALAWAYVAFGSLPPIVRILYGVKPVIIAIVLQALWKLGKTCVRSWHLAILGLAAITAIVAGLHELIVLLACGLIVILARRLARPRPLPLFALALPPGEAPPLIDLFGVFAKIGSILFGSGYVLLAYLRADLVERRGWLTEAQLLDAIAVGQVTPGPLFTTATFLGFLLAGVRGAVVATAGIFLPAFFFVALSVPLLARMKRSVTARAFLDGVNVASLALMGVVTAQLARSAVVDVPTAMLAILSAVVLLQWRINSAWLVLAGAVVGLARLVLERAVG